MPAYLPPVCQRDTVQRLMGSAMIPPNAHAGLLYQRYLKVWDSSGERIDSPARHYLEEFAKDYRQLRRSQGGLLKEMHQRLDEVVDRAGGETAPYTCRARLALGLGGAHPLEVGFTFDPIVGVPFLAGSSVKGMCRAWAQFLVDRNELAESVLVDLFGRDSKPGGADGSVGDIAFLPAYPQEWPKLSVDVMNPHHARYYGLSAEERDFSGPTDTENPVPVFFLTVRRGARFVFRWLSRRGSAVNLARGGESTGAAETNFELVREVLGQAVEVLGAGAKTALGYGRMKAEAKS